MGRALLALSVLPLVLACCNRIPEEPGAIASVRPASTLVIPAASVRPASPEAAPAQTASVVTAAAPALACPRDPEGPLPLPTIPLAVDSGAHLVAELARLPHETERGLMYRTSMPEDRGMLFRLDRRDDHVFWMHNTCLPLDMLFIDQDGTIVGVLEDVPILNDEPRSVGRLSTHVLEVNAGWARRHGVRVGQKLLLPASAK